MFLNRLFQRLFAKPPPPGKHLCLGKCQRYLWPHQLEEEGVCQRCIRTQLLLEDGWRVKYWGLRGPKP